MDEISWKGKQKLEDLTPTQICELIRTVLKKHNAETTASMVKLNSRVWNQNLAHAIWLSLQLNSVSDGSVSPNGFKIS